MKSKKSIVPISVTLILYIQNVFHL